MKKRHLPREYEAYTIYETDEFQRAVNENYSRLKERERDGRYPENYADRWHNALYDFLESMKHPYGSAGKIDPEHYSDKYAYKQVPGTNSTVFYLVEEDQIFLATVGFSRMNWKKILQEAQQDIDRAIGKLQERLEQEQNNEQRRH